MELIQAKQSLIKLGSALSKEEIIKSFIGSVSMRFEHASFVINKNNIIFSAPKEDDFLLLDGKKDYRWKEASVDALVHQNIYKNIPTARYICACVPPYVSAYALEHSSFEPRDLWGEELFGNIFIYETKQNDDWSERAPSEILRYFTQTNSNVMIMKGCGICVYERTMDALLKTIFALENSAKLMSIAKSF